MTLSGCGMTNEDFMQGYEKYLSRKEIGKFY